MPTCCVPHKIGSFSCELICKIGVNTIKCSTEILKVETS